MDTFVFATLAIPSLLFFFFTSRHRDGRFFFTFCLANTISIEVIALTYVLDHYFGDDRYIGLFVSRVLIFLVLEYLVWKHLRGSYLLIQNRIKKGWWLCALVSILFYALLALMTAYPTVITQRATDIPALVLIFILMPLTYAATYQVLLYQNQLYKSEIHQRNMDRQAKLMRHELEAEREYVDQARRARHDMRHNIRVVREYLNRNDPEGAKAYLSEYDQAITDGALEQYCENDVVNTVLHIYARRCAQKQTALRIRTVIPPTLPYTYTETGTLFGNLLENACDAADKCPDPFVEVFAECRDNTLFVTLRNSVMGRVEFQGDLPVSTKPGGGIGIRSAGKILNRYGGMMRMTQEGDVFVTQIIQPME